MELSLSDAELWGLTWREFDALAVALRGRIRRDDARAARICQSVVGAMTGNTVELEQFMPAEAQTAGTSDELVAAQAKVAMERAGLKPEYGRPRDPAHDEFREKMNHLIGAK